MGEIYVLTNKETEKKYIGQAVCYLSNGKKWGAIKRWQSHINRAMNNICECRLLENAIRKYGFNSFDILIIHTCPIEELNYWENFYIQEFNTITPNGYNLMTGGGNGRTHTQETKELMSKTRTGKLHSEITKQKIGIAHKGKEVMNITREKIGKTSKWRNISPENKEKIMEALKELNLTELPMYIGYSLDKRYDRNIDVITVRHPNINQKKFASKYNTLAEKIKLAIEYKNCA